MLSWEADVEAHALREHGWTISALARQLDHDRKTIRAYLSGTRVLQRRVRREPTLAEPAPGVLRAAAERRPASVGSTLFDELTALGFAGSYPSLTAAIRTPAHSPHYSSLSPATPPRPPLPRSSERGAEKVAEHDREPAPRSGDQRERLFRD